MPLAVMHETVFMADDDLVQNLADSCEKLFERKYLAPD